MLDGGEINAATFERLRLTDKKIAEMTRSMLAVAELPDPLGRVLQRTELDAGLVLEKITLSAGSARHHLRGPAGRRHANQCAGIEVGQRGHPQGRAARSSARRSALVEHHSAGAEEQRASRRFGGLGHRPGVRAATARDVGPS